MSIKDIYKLFLSKLDKNERTKKGMQNLIIVLVIGILMLFIGGFLNKDETGQKENSIQVENTTGNIKHLDEYDLALQNKLQAILSEISGVGKVSIAITYSSGKEIVPAQDIKRNESNTNEKNQEGGVRNTTETDTDSKVIVGQQNETKPVILKEIPPQIKGVVVVADGAGDGIVKVNIEKAVSTALGISLSKIEVFPRGN